MYLFGIFLIGCLLFGNLLDIARLFLYFDYSFLVYRMFARLFVFF